MKPTPETDAKKNQILSDVSSMRIDGWNEAYHHMSIHAEKLERERNELREAMEALLKDHNQFSMDRFEMEGVDPYGNDSEAYDTAQKIIEGYKPLPTPPADADAAPDAS